MPTLESLPFRIADTSSIFGELPVNTKIDRTASKNRRDRMLYREGLDLKMKKPELVKPLLQPFPPDQMAGYPVSEKVNKADQEGPECVRPVDAEL
jgi:hypothetical protein